MILGQQVKTENGWGRIETIGDCPFANFRAGIYYYVVSTSNGWADWMSEAKLQYAYAKPHAQKFYKTLFDNIQTGDLLNIVLAAIGNNDNLALAATLVLIERLQWEDEEFCQQEIIDRLVWNSNPLTNRIYEAAAENITLQHCEECDRWFFDETDFGAHWIMLYPSTEYQPEEWGCPGRGGYDMNYAYDEARVNRPDRL